MNEGARPTPGSPPLLEVRGLAAAYGRSQVLHGVDLEVGAGEMTSLLGRNGMGKTTTVYSIMGLVRPRGGSVRMAGRELAGQPPWRIGRAGLGLVPEARQIFPNLNTHENLIATRAGAPQRRRRGMDGGTSLRAVPGTRGAAHDAGVPPLGRRAADAVHRARPHDQPRTVDPRRSDGRAGPPGAPGDLGLPRAAQGGRAIHPHHRQEHRRPRPHRGPSLHPRDRAVSYGAERAGSFARAPRSLRATSGSDPWQEPSPGLRGRASAAGCTA